MPFELSFLRKYTQQVMEQNYITQTKLLIFFLTSTQFYNEICSTPVPVYVISVRYKQTGWEQQLRKVRYTLAIIATAEPDFETSSE